MKCAETIPPPNGFAMTYYKIVEHFLLLLVSLAAPCIPLLWSREKVISKRIYKSSDVVFSSVSRPDLGTQALTLDGRLLDWMY